MSTTTKTYGWKVEGGGVDDVDGEGDPPRSWSVIASARALASPLSPARERSYRRRMVRGKRQPVPVIHLGSEASVDHRREANCVQ